MRPEIIFEDDYMLACIKPYGVPSQPDKTGGEDMLTLVKEYLFEEACIETNENEAEEPYAAVINRLDRPVGGIILFAKSQEAASKLTDMIQDGEISKYYQAVVSGFMKEPEGSLKGYLLHDKKDNISRMVSKDTRGAKKAELRYEVLDELETDEGEISYLLIELLTGRHHQIRCQLAAEGHPIWNDSKYGKSGKSKKKARGIGLFSTRIEFTHPYTGEDIVLHREPEGEAFDIIDQMDW